MLEATKLAEAAGSADARVGLRAALALRRLADGLETQQVESARRQGWSWQEIVVALEASKQAVHMKYAGRARLRGTREVSDAGVAHAVLHDAGLDQRGVRAELAPLVPLSGTKLSDEDAAALHTIGTRDRFGTLARKVLELSLGETLRLRDDHVGPEHLLPGLLHANEGLAARILADAGLDPEDLRRRTEAALDRAA
jgi:hypothetical protein